MTKEELAELKYSPEEIAKKVKIIYRRCLAETKNFDSGNFMRIGTKDLQSIFRLYDQYFFKGFFQNNYNGKIYYNLSRRMTRSAGKMEFNKHSGEYIISLSTTLIYQTFQDVKREVAVNGIVCHNRLEATIHVLEHEIIHLLEIVLYGSSSCSKPRFKSMSRNIFNHTDVTHKLVTQAEIAQKKFKLRAGDKVLFEYEGRIYRGIVSRITQRATVMVKNKNGDFKDAKGIRYSKYYVPLQHLKPLRESNKRLFLI